MLLYSHGLFRITKDFDMGLRKYTIEGGYPLFYYDALNNVFCADCSEDTTYLKVNINWENPQLFCDCCEERIESAYAELDDTETADITEVTNE